MTEQLSAISKNVMVSATGGNHNLVNDPVYKQCVAAAFNTAVNHGKMGPEEWEGSSPDDYENGWNAALDYIMKIATELEARYD